MTVVEHPATAQEKAKALLLSHLKPYQRLTYEKWGFFYVRGSNLYTYALWDGYWVGVIVKGKPIEFMGAYPSITGMHFNPHTADVRDMPVEDKILGQKLMLETSPSRVHDVACHWAPDSFYSTWTCPKVLVEGFPAKEDWDKPKQSYMRFPRQNPEDDLYEEYRPPVQHRPPVPPLRHFHMPVAEAIRQEYHAEYHAEINRLFRVEAPPQPEPDLRPDPPPTPIQEFLELQEFDNERQRMLHRIFHGDL